VFDYLFASGSGLGLAIGHIAVTSEVGAGTTFEVYLPAKKTQLLGYKIIM